jgi:hypothetical protein
MGLVPSQDRIDGLGEPRNISESVFVKWSTNFFRQRCKYGWIATWFQFVFVHQEIYPIAQLARVKPKNRLIFFAGREQLLCQDVKADRVLILDCASKLFDRQGGGILSRRGEDPKKNESYDAYRSHYRILTSSELREPLLLRFEHFVHHAPDLRQRADCRGEGIEHHGVIDGIRAAVEGRFDD